MSHRIVLIYGLAGPDGVIRYVGQTQTTIEDRLMNHIRRARRNDSAMRVAAWIRELDYAVTISLLEETAERGSLRERYWIAELKTGIADGGFNAHMGSKARAEERKPRPPISEETRRKRSEWQRGKPKLITPEQRAKMAATWSQNHWAKKREALGLPPLAE